jgi:hypothetical protein
LFLVCPNFREPVTHSRFAIFGSGRLLRRRTQYTRECDRVSLVRISGTGPFGINYFRSGLSAFALVLRSFLWKIVFPLWQTTGSEALLPLC